MGKQRLIVFSAVNKAFSKQLYRSCLAFVICFFTFSCQGDDPYLYDKVGFTPGMEPYRQRPPVYYPSYGAPNSRVYSNPYDFPSRNYYYDMDRYYVPPTYYRNVEPEYNSGPDMKY